jgi:hypothetical protein
MMRREHAAQQSFPPPPPPHTHTRACRPRPPTAPFPGPHPADPAAGEWKRICKEYHINKSGSQAKDKWRNLCISATTGREDRGLAIPEHIKARVRAP